MGAGIARIGLQRGNGDREFAMASGEMTSDEFRSFLESVFGHMAGHSSDGSIHFICMDWRHLGETLAAGTSIYAELKNLCVWVKSNGGMGTFYRSRHELVFAFKNGTAAHINNFELGYIETGEFNGKVKIYEPLQLDRQYLLVPAGFFGKAVVGQDIGALLPLIEMLNAQRWHLLPSEQLGRRHATVAGNYPIVFID